MRVPISVLVAVATLVAMPGAPSRSQAALPETEAAGPNIDPADWGLRLLSHARAANASTRAGKTGAVLAGGTDVELEGWNETTIAVDPANPQHLACASLFDLRVSTDGGATWQSPVNPPVPPEFAVNGDPSVAFDSQGRLFWSFLASPLAPYFGLIGSDIFIARCDPATGGVLPGYPINVTAGIGLPASSGDFHDKEWLAADGHPASPFADRLYLVWTEFPVSSAERTRFTWSSDQGVTWSPPQTLGDVVDTAFVWPVHVAVAPNGDVFVSEHRQPHFVSSAPDGVSGFVNLFRSTDGGVSFPQLTQPFAAGRADATFNVQTSGGAIPGAKFWLQGGAQAWVLPDPQVSGRIYVVAADDPDDTVAGDPSNVYLARSFDAGATWQAPIRIDSGPGTSFQVMPTASIDPATGVLAVQYYDNRSGAVNAQGHWLLDVYATVIPDPGAAFLDEVANHFEVRVNDQAFDPDAGARCRFGCGQQFSDVWAGPSGNAFAVALNGNFLRYNGTTWSSVATTSVSKNGIWGSSNTNVYTVGSGGEIRRYNGASVQAVTSPTSNSLYGIDGRTSADIFAVGGGGVIAHYNGTSWSLETSPTTTDLHQVWANPSGDVFAVGRNGVVVRRSGTTWSPMASPGNRHLFGIWGTGDSNIYVTSIEGGLYHWDGGTWTSIPTGLPALLGIWGSAANDIHVLGIGHMLHFDGVNWTSEDFTERFCYRIDGTASNSAFTVGEMSTIARFDGTSWTQQSNPLTPSNPSLRIGEYNGIASQGGQTYLIWCGNTHGNGNARDQQAVTDRFDAGEVTGVSLYDPLFAARTLELEAPSPNPSRGAVSVGYALPRSAPVDLALFDLSGRRVTTLLRGEQPPGRHVVGWDAAALPPGVYSLRLRAAGETHTRKFVIVR